MTQKRVKTAVESAKDGALAHIVNLLINHHRAVTRTLAWVGILAIIVISVVPATDRPITGAGQLPEHVTAFALVAGMFAIGCRLSTIRLLALAFFFCGGVELLQVPFSTRHARVSDFVIDFVGSCVAIGFVFAADKLISAWNIRSRPK